MQLGKCAGKYPHPIINGYDPHVQSQEYPRGAYFAEKAGKLVNKAKYSTLFSTKHKK